MRSKLFTSIIYKPVSWFDNKNRAPGILSNILSEDITQLNGLTTETIGNILEAVLGFIIGIILSVIFNWRIALVTLAVSPTVFIGGVMMSNFQWKNKGGGSKQL